MSTPRKKSGGTQAEPPAPDAASTPKPQAANKPKAAKKKSSAAEPAAGKTARPAAKKAAKKAPAKAAATDSAAKKKSADVRESAAGDAGKAAPKPRKSSKKAAALTGPVVDPIGDLSDGEAQRSLAPQAEPESAAMMEAYRADTASDAGTGTPELEPAPTGREEKARKRAKAKAKAAGKPAEAGPADEEDAEAAAEAELESDEERDEEPASERPEPKLERLQKILSQAGISSRRHAEEMIVAGQVMVNGQVVTQLGAKADPGRDHIRVNGKLIHIAVRHRTFMLNKPKGFVTTVSDPEGRPTVMQFFEKVRERLYPVGRLDYQSEGLLLMTNDGELANLLTRAASGVEKTYLVKVSGQPGEGALEQLRAGVSIDREQPGSGKVHAAPKYIRPFRSGDNPWYEVVLTEGRNRELRKMFNAVGHFVEKIRRVGYGPLVLDVEPGQIRELTAEEVNALRQTAEGKLKPKRPKLWPMPKGSGRPEKEGEKARAQRPGGPRPQKAFGQREDKPFRPRQDRGPAAPGGASTRFPNLAPSRSPQVLNRIQERGPNSSSTRPDAGGRPAGGFERRGPSEGFDRRGPSSFSGPRPERPSGPRPERSGSPRFDRPGGPRPERPQRPGGGRFEDRREPNRGQGFGERERSERPRFEGKPRFEREGRAAREGRGGFRPERPRGEREGFRGEERPPRAEFRPRENGAPRFERPIRFGGEQRRDSNRPEGRPNPAGLDIRREDASQFEGKREYRPGSGQRPSGGPRSSGGQRSGGERRPSSGPRPSGEYRSGSGQRSGGGRPGGGQRSGGGSRPGGGQRPASQGRRPGFGSRPGGGSRGGPPRRGRG